MDMKFVGAFVGFAILALIVINLSYPLAVSESEEVVYYQVTATNRTDMLTQLSELGPKGAAGLTEWQVRWNWVCKVNIHTTISLPQHTNLDALSTAQRESWQNFVQKLHLHERLHQFNGQSAARDIARHYCINADFISRYWMQKDVIFDYVSRHGQRDGVVLYWSN